MENRKTNAKVPENYSQVCVWPGTVVGGQDVLFKEEMFKMFGVRVHYLEEIMLALDPKRPNARRHDVFFAVHDEDISKFAVPRLAAGIRWIEDVLDNEKPGESIYPSRVVDYRTW